MNADTDVERAIAGWLQETAVRRAPDRVLEQAVGAVHRTKQRPRAAWRNTMFSSLPKVLAAGVAIVAIALGAGLIGRSTAGAGDPSPTLVPASASPESHGQAIARYRLERNRICAAAQLEKDQLSARFQYLFEPDATDGQRSDGIVAMEAFIELTDQVTDELASLDPPADISEAHATNVTQYRDMLALLRHMVGLQKAGNFEDAVVVSDTTDAITTDMEAFERANQLTACP